MPSRPCRARMPAAAERLVQMTPAAACRALRSRSGCSGNGMCSRIHTRCPAAAAASSSSGAPHARRLSTSVTEPGVTVQSSRARRRRSPALPPGQSPSSGQVSTSAPRAVSSAASAAL